MLEGKLKLGDGDVAPATIDALANIVAYARSRVLAPNGDPSIAVHEHRKALRRARSLARMLRPMISKKTRRSVEQALRAAHRQYADHRDSDARAGAWRALAQRHHFSVPEADEALSSGAGNGSRKLAPPHRKPVDDAIALLAERLPATMVSDDLRRGLKATYRDARAALRRVRVVADPAHVHRLRRRCKDISNQLELIESIEARPAAKWRKRFSALTKSLGDVTDLYMVREGLDDVWRAHPALDPVLKRDIDRALDADIAAGVAASLETAERLLGAKSRKFSDKFNL